MQRHTDTQIDVHSQTLQFIGNRKQWKDFKQENGMIRSAIFCLWDKVRHLLRFPVSSVYHFLFPLCFLYIALNKLWSLLPMGLCTYSCSFCLKMSLSSPLPLVNARAYLQISSDVTPLLPTGRHWLPYMCLHITQHILNSSDLLIIYLKNLTGISLQGYNVLTPSLNLQGLALTIASTL